MITFTFAGDESGDASFNFEKGASRYFVMTAISTLDPDGLRQNLDLLRSDLNLASQYEFGFHKIVSEKLRNKILMALTKMDFEAWVVLVDKAQLVEAFKGMNGLEFYLYFVVELIQAIPAEKRSGASLILDEYGYPDKTKEELKRILKNRRIKHGFRRISMRRSQSESLIQVADLIAGAIWRRDTNNDTGAYELIEPKIVKLVEYRGY